MTYRRGRVWWISYVDAEGRRHREATHARTKAEAEELLRAIRSRIDRQRRGLEPVTRNPERHTVRSLVEWALKKKARTKNAHSLGLTLRAHVVGTFADTRIEDVTGPRVRVWLDERQHEAGLADATVNRLRAYLSGVFSLGAAVPPGGQRRRAAGSGDRGPP